MTNLQSHAALEQLYREHKDHVFNYLARLTHDRELARDVTQQTFLKALTDPNLGNLDAPKAYLFTVARNTLYDEWKRKKERLLAEGEEQRAQEMPDDPMETPHERAASRDMRDKIEAAVNLMRPKYRELMLLRYGEDLTVDEIAQITGRGLSDVKVNLHRARLAFDKDFTALMYSRVARTRGKCDEIIGLLAPFENREMPAEQIKVVDAHLSACELCAEDAGEMKKRRELFVALPLLPAPPALDQAIQPALLPGAKSAVVSKTATTGVIAKTVAAVGIASLLAGGIYFLVKIRGVTAPTEAPTAVVADRAIPAAPTEASGGAETNRSEPTAAATGSIHLQARTTSGGPLLDGGLSWRIDSVDPTTGQRKNVTRDARAAPTIKLPAGRYAIQVSHRQRAIAAKKEIVVESGANAKTIDMILEAGGFGWQGPPVVGTFETYTRRQPAEKMTGKFYVSREGFRSEMLMPGSRMVTIQNAKSGKCWHVNEAKAIYSEVAVNKKTGDCPSFMGEAMDAGASKSPVGDVPCAGYANKVAAGGGAIAGRQADKWNCSGGQGNASATQWHDRTLGMLLKEETSTGEVMVFTDVKETSFAASLLGAPKGMKRVTADEFLGVLFGGIPR